MKPKVTFKVSARKDIQSLKAFAYQFKYDEGRSLGWAIKPHQSLKAFIKKDEIIIKSSIRKYVSIVYQKNQKTALKNIEKYGRDWKKKENIFLELAHEIFPRLAWPKGKYVAYTTIWGVFPRFLEDKTFQIPMVSRQKKNYVSVVIAHEMLHFLFYEYITKNHPEYKNPEQNMLVWHMSEIFNSVVMNSAPWLLVFKEKTAVYPEHRKIVTILKKKYPNPSQMKIEDFIWDAQTLAKPLVKIA
jgi:hypothetical protein